MSSAAFVRRVSQELCRRLPHLRSRRSIRGLQILPQGQPPVSANVTTLTLRRYLSTEEDQEKRRKHQLALDENFDSDPEKASGKTVVNILNMETEEGIFFSAYSTDGFRLSTGMRVMGPCAVFPRSILHWNVASVQDISEASLKLFTVLEPRLDILIIGVGISENTRQVSPDIIKFLRANKVNVEILPTDQALATFNFLNSEKRYVAAALIPPSYVVDERFDTLAEGEIDGNITMTEYDYIPPDPDEKMKQAILESSTNAFKDVLYQRKKREQDMQQNPKKYQED